MKVFLLVVGLGTRLRPLTDSTPKCLLPILGVPLLKIWLRLCRQHGIDEVLINTHSGQVENYVAAHRDGVNTMVVDEPTLRGSAGTIAANRSWVAAESSFWIFYADVLTNTNLTRMMQFHRAHQSTATLGGYEVPDPERCGIMEVCSDGRIESSVEKPESSRGPWPSLVSCLPIQAFLTLSRKAPPPTWVLMSFRNWQERCLPIRFPITSFLISERLVTMSLPRAVGLD